MCDSGLLEMNHGSVKMQKNKIIKIKSKNKNSGTLCQYFQKSIRSEWDFVRVNTEFPIKNHPIESSFTAKKNTQKAYNQEYGIHKILLGPRAASGTSGLDSVLGPALRAGPRARCPPLPEGNLKSRRQPARQNLLQHRIRHAAAGPHKSKSLSMY